MSRQLSFPCKCISDLLDGGVSTCQVPPTMIVELERDGRPVGTRPADSHRCQHVVPRLETWCRRCWDAGCDRNVTFRPTAVDDIVLEDDEEKGKEKKKAKANPLAQTNGQATISPAAVSSEAYAGPSGRQPASGRGITVTHEITRTVTAAPVLAAPTVFGRNATTPGRASNPSVVMPPPPPSVRRSLRQRFNRSPPPPLPVSGPLGAQTPTTTTTTSAPAVASNSTTTTSGATRRSTVRRVSERIRALTSRAKNPDSTPSSSSPTPAAVRSASASSGSVSSGARTTATSGDPAPPAPPLRRSARTPAAKNSGTGLLSPTRLASRSRTSTGSGENYGWI